MYATRGQSVLVRLSPQISAFPVARLAFKKFSVALRMPLHTGRVHTQRSPAGEQTALMSGEETAAKIGQPQPECRRRENLCAGTEGGEPSDVIGDQREQGFALDEPAQGGMARAGQHGGLKVRLRQA